MPPGERAAAPGNRRLPKAPKFTALDEDLYAYILAHVHEDELLARLREETERIAPEWIQMQIGPDQGALMALLARAIGARRALELGTFTGYSAICVARALPEDGRLVTCDVSKEWTGVASRYFAEAGLGGRIELRLGPAIETLGALAGAGAEPFAFAFIDADKPSYPDYWEAVVQLVRPGGLILVDNVLYGGAVVASDVDEGRCRSLEAIRETNARIAADERAESVMLGVADGLTIALRR